MTQDVITATQERMLATMRGTQDVFVQAVSMWSDVATKMAAPVGGPATFSGTRRSAEAVDSAFEFAQRWLATQRRFARQLFGVAAPVRRHVENAPTGEQARPSLRAVKA